MRQIYNISPNHLVLDWKKRAIAPCKAVFVADEVADELCAGPDWSYENPRPRRVKQQGE